MAVTTSKTNIMTIIQEDGSDPSGAGGKIINDNFKKIDDLFDGDDCKSALVANSLASAPSIAANTGFSNPAASGANYRVSSGGVNYPVSIWGTEFQTGTYHSDSGMGMTLAPIAKVPPYGPFAYRVMTMISPNSAQDEDYSYIEFVIYGYDGNLGPSNVQGGIVYPSNTSWKLTQVPVPESVHLPDDYCIGVTIENGTLYCGGTMPANNDSAQYFACVMHVTVLSLYSNAATFPDTNIYAYTDPNES